MFEVIVKAIFLEQPKFYLEKNILSWLNPYSYVGGDESNLIVKFSKNGQIAASYKMQIGVTNLCEECNLEPDLYDWNVYVNINNIFETEAERISFGQCILGDENTFRFKGKKIMIEYIREERDRIFIKPFFIENLNFKKLCNFDQESIKYPLYRGIAYYFDNKLKRKTYFSSKVVKTGIGKYALNPVDVYVISNKILGITDIERDGLLWHKIKRCITDENESKKNKIDLGLPDYYEYKTIGEK